MCSLSLFLACLMQKKIFCVSLIGKQQVQATAVFEDDLLVVTELKRITGPFGVWKSRLRKELKKKHDAGYHMLIEELGDEFSEYAQKVQLSDSDPVARRAYMSIAFDHYFHLINLGGAADGQQRGCLVLNKGRERHWISENAVNVVADDKGRYGYDVDHSKFSSEQRALLLCVLAACEFNQTNTAYADEFLTHINSDQEESPLSTLINITIGRDHE